MELESTPVAVAAVPRPSHWYRLRFQKVEALRLVSHIDLLHCFERMLRRAELPFAVTQGFHPKACLVFAQALALGVAGLDEVVDLELTQPLEPDEVLERLRRQAPPGLYFHRITALGRKGSAQVRRAFYRLTLPASDPDLAGRCLKLLARDRCIVERAKPGSVRRIDIRPYLCEVKVEGTALIVAVWITPYGAARPEEVVRALGLGELLDAGAVLERTTLEMMDEQPEGDRWLPEIPRLADAVLGEDEVLVTAAAAPELSTPAGEALLANPLSFET